MSRSAFSLSEAPAITEDLPEDDYGQHKRESIDDDHGLWHRTVKWMTNITLRHLVDPTSGYQLVVNRKMPDGEEVRAQIFFTPAEALGLCEAISASLYLVAFGVPTVQTLGAVAD